jgi:type II secretory pathway pseudopilin PulG
MRNTQQIQGESGYAMAALLVAMAFMALFMSIAMPVWKQAAQREKEEELVWRGRQYDRAIQLFRRKTSAPGAPNLDMLVNQRYLRRKYKDPITDKEFALKPVALAGVNMPPGVPQPPGMSQQPGSSQSPGPSQSPGSQQVPGGNGQLIGGVRSTSKAKSIRVLNGRDHYDQWEFVYTPYGTKTTSAGPAAQPGTMPGQNTPGSPTGPGGSPRPGTSPGSTPPSPSPTPSPSPPPAPEPMPEPSEPPPDP